MLLLSEAETKEALPFPALIAALEDMFRTGCDMPVRHHHDIKVPGEPDATLLLMPAWVPGRYSGVKIAHVVPGNADRGLAAVSASYLLSDARTGAALALIDGGELTARRTAAASALAAKYLAREESSELLVAGTGRLASNLIGAHAAVRPIRSVKVWGRSHDKAQGVADRAKAEYGLSVEVADNLEEACATADIISAATLSIDPLIKGAWLKPGTHLDLVGAFRPDMRESDDEAVCRGRVFVDTREGCCKEGGDIVQPLKSGVLTPERILADLYNLTRGSHPGRTAPVEITLFKSVGAALEDLAGAVLAYRSVKASMVWK
ncbi:ornithine cyclodeaminase family protein [Roseibium sp. RKSG952]|uniref:ornithine cyclodeaminase family protein n=1 Tax=Roseibium sp. RKSG952 TaxID=2529384 RepID=UPI0012BD11CB|nr:ornithine cyclodeaminase family protein [Roseibium sp. RKSG952]MTH98335.1 ornithine cyclodeaminase family protein [Roseibium sp. RKSG952]